MSIFDYLVLPQSIKRSEYAFVERNALLKNKEFKEKIIAIIKKYQKTKELHEKHFFLDVNQADLKNIDSQQYKYYFHIFQQQGGGRKYIGTYATQCFYHSMETLVFDTRLHFSEDEYNALSHNGKIQLIQLRSMKTVIENILKRNKIEEAEENDIELTKSYLSISEEENNIINEFCIEYYEYNKSNIFDSLTLHQLRIIQPSFIDAKRSLHKSVKNLFLK